MKFLLHHTIYFCCIMFFLFSCSETYTNEEIDAMFKEITSRYGIKIVYKIEKDYPPMLVDGKRWAFDEVAPIDHRVLARYPRILNKALQKYPDQVISKYLDAIYFAREIKEDGVEASGTYGYFCWAVYLVNNGLKSDEYAESTFHHEFSSILIVRNGIYLNPWFKQNPKDFKYLYEINENRADVKITGKGTRADYKDGFVTDYGRTTFENDFNEYSAMIFTYPDKFKKIMNHYPKVRGKFLIWLDFYYKIDPIFTEAYLLGED